MKDEKRGPGSARINESDYRPLTPTYFNTGRTFTDPGVILGHQVPVDIGFNPSGLEEFFKGAAYITEYKK